MLRQQLKDWYNYKIKYPYQRATRGYSDLDLWNMNDWFFETGLKILNRWLDDGILSYPSYMNHKEYVKMLEEMRDGFQAYVDSENMKDYDECTYEEYARLDNERMEKAKKSLELFAKHGMGLWD